MISTLRIAKDLFLLLAFIFSNFVWVGVCCGYFFHQFHDGSD